MSMLLPSLWTSLSRAVVIDVVSVVNVPNGVNPVVTSVRVFTVG